MEGMGSGKSKEKKKREEVRRRESKEEMVWEGKREKREGKGQGIMEEAVIWN